MERLRPACFKTTFDVRCVAGVPRPSETAPHQDPTVAICLGPDVGPRGWMFSYERGHPEQGTSFMMFELLRDQTCTT